MIARLAPAIAVAALALGCSLHEGGKGSDDGASDGPDAGDLTEALPDFPDAPDGPADPVDSPDIRDVLDASDTTDPVTDPEEEEIPPLWLADWAKRVMLVLDHNDVPNHLVEFPFLLHLSASAGREDEDVTFVFDELSDDTLRKRMAVTTDDGVTQCAVEIEKWDSAGRTAWLWIKAPFVSYASDTVLYLYYDASRPDNTSHVDDTNEPAAELVWDGGYMGVWHISEGRDFRTFDSTLLNNHGNVNRSNHWGSGWIDGSYSFDGGDDYVDCGDHASLMPATGLTLEMWLSVVEYHDWDAAVSLMWDNDDVESGYWLGSRNWDGPLVFWVKTTTGAWAVTSHTVPVSEWHHVVGTYDGSNVRLYVDAVEVSSVAATGPIDYDPLPYALYIGRYHDSDEDNRMEMDIDELRISDRARPPAWIRASFESQLDDFVDFGAEELVSP